MRNKTKDLIVGKDDMERTMATISAHAHEFTPLEQMDFPSGMSCSLPPRLGFRVELQWQNSLTRSGIGWLIVCRSRVSLVSKKRCVFDGPLTCQARSASETPYCAGVLGLCYSESSDFVIVWMCSKWLYSSGLDTPI